MSSNRAAEDESSLSTVSLLDLVLGRLGGEILRVLHEAGFTDARPGHGFVMGLLQAGPRRLGDLADRTGISPQAMSQLVDRLEALGYVERRPDPDDRRAVRVHLGKRGKAGGEAAGRANAAVEAWVSEVLGVAGHRRLRRDLQRLLRRPAALKGLEHHQPEHDGEAPGSERGQQARPH